MRNQRRSGSRSRSTSSRSRQDGASTSSKSGLSNVKRSVSNRISNMRGRNYFTWRTMLPTIAAIGAGAYLLRRREGASL